MKYILVFLLVLSLIVNIDAQDTFSMVAVDSTTNQVGSAGASCVDLTGSGMTGDFIGELLPGLGAINTQSWYDATNQANARNRMLEGLTPTQIIDWLNNNDVTNQPELRQYGIVGFVNDGTSASASTGSSNTAYANHIITPTYAIAGNILSGQAILDSMESHFLAEQGSLACKLMGALQGAKVVGADTRCASNGTSALFAYVKVADPTDEFGDPSFIISVETMDGQGIEPIDALQNLFDNAYGSCAVKWYQDLDGDLFGNPDEVLLSNTEPSGYVLDNTDCDDQDSNIGGIGSACEDNNACTPVSTTQEDCSCWGEEIIQTNTFVGGNNLWLNASNWSLGTLPDVCHEVVIPAGLTVDLLDGEEGSCYSLQVSNSATLNVAGTANLKVIAQ